MHDAYVNARGFKNVFYAYVQFYFQGTVLDSLLFSKHSKRSRGIKQEWNQTFLYKRNSKSFIHSIQNRVQGLSTKYSFKHKGKYNIKKRSNCRLLFVEIFQLSFEPFYHVFTKINKFSH